MIISDASEVVGRGFTTSPVKYHQYPGDALSMPHTKNEHAAGILRLHLYLIYYRDMVK